jgi:hypothetical protein
MHTVPTEERPEGHPVARAIAALKAYAGPDIDRDTASRILAEWAEFDTLDPHDVLEVTLALPPGPPRRSMRGGGMSSGAMILPGGEM